MAGVKRARHEGTRTLSCTKPFVLRCDFGPWLRTIRFRSPQASSNWRSFDRIMRPACNSHSKAIVAVLELGRDAAASRDASDLDLMPPRPAPGSAPRSRCWTLRIARRRIQIVMLVIPIRAPLVNILRDVVKPKAVRRALPDSLGSIQPKLRVIRLKQRSFVAPGVQLAFESATRRSFPLGFGWKAISLSGFL